MVRKITKEEFIQRAQNVHQYPKEDFDYSNINYVNIGTKIKIHCNKCNNDFWQVPHSHLQGFGCPYCAGNIRFTADKLIEKFKTKHLEEEFDYSNICEYKGYNKKVPIICKKCNKLFYQTPHLHLRGCGCPHCLGKTKTVSDVIASFQKIHGVGNFDYCLFTEYKNNKKKIIIKCNKCKKFFYQRISDHLDGSGCPHCKKSKGENAIKNWLMQKNINFIFQKTFDGCKKEKHLRFDFYLPNHNLCIEFNGKQHYDPKMLISLCKSKEKGMKSFQAQIKRDQIKRDFCVNNNIQLLEIRYDENIESKLEQTIKQITTKNSTQ